MKLQQFFMEQRKDSFLKRFVFFDWQHMFYLKEHVSGLIFPDSAGNKRSRIN